WAGRCICCCCAAVGILAAMPPATNASRAGQSFRMTFMENLLFPGSWESANETTPQGIGLLQRPVVFPGESLKAMAQVLVSAMQMHTVARLRPQQMACRTLGRVPI